MIDDKKVPEIRFIGFAEPWKMCTLGELGNVMMNRRIFRNQTTEFGDIPFYKIGTFGSRADAFISKELFNEYKSKYPYPKIGDLLISAAGSIGKVVEYKGEDAYFQDSNIVWLSHDKQIISSFLKQFYTVAKWDVLEGSTLKRLYNKDILEMIIHLPAIDEQTIIGSFLRVLDETIILKRQQYEQTANIKKSMLEKMFPTKGADMPEIRFDGFAEPWKKRKLGEHTKLITKGTTPKDKSGHGNINFIKVENIINGQIIPVSRITVDEHENYLSRSKLEENDILFSIAGTLGRTALVCKSILPANTNQALAIIRGYDFDIQFLLVSLNGSMVVEYLQRNPVVGAQPNLSLAQIGDLTIWTPSKTEQIAIGNFFLNLDALIETQRQALEKLQNIKNACLSKLFV
ncbi:MAG: restriction endonuclease subunit S [Defluviitaleaceae bacterium]|nr:restriction endonuclease subunit S [Defluviitaleaceae bacterium]